MSKTKVSRGSPRRQFPKAFDRAMWVLTVAAIVWILTALVQAFRGHDSWVSALAQVILAGLAWLVLSATAAAATGAGRPSPGPAHPVHRGISSVPHQRDPGQHPAPGTLKGRATIPASTMLAAPPQSRHLVVVQAQARAVADVLEQAARARIGLCWETMQTTVHSAADLNGWVVLVEVEAER